MLRLPDRLRMARVARRLRQADVAQAMDWSPATQSDYERDVAEPSVEELKRLSSFLGVSAVWLILGDGDMFAGQPVEVAA